MNEETARSNDRTHEHDEMNEETEQGTQHEQAQASTSSNAEDETVDATSAEPSSDVEALEQELGEKDQRLQETIARLQRLQADFENYKKRVARERDEQARRTENEILLEILPVYDSFDRAFRNYQHNGDEAAFIEGMEQVFAQLHDALADLDVHPIDAEGQAFDPSRHEALMNTETDEHPPNTVVEAFERGYVRGNDVLRPSRVMVSRKPSRSRETTEANDGSESESEPDHEGGTD